MFAPKTNTAAIKDDNTNKYSVQIRFHRVNSIYFENYIAIKRRVV